jgi:proline racemase
MTKVKWHVIKEQYIEGGKESEGFTMTNIVATGDKKNCKKIAKDLGGHDSDLSYGGNTTYYYCVSADQLKEDSAYE